MYERITEPLLATIKRELGSTIAKVHSANKTRGVANPMDIGDSSPYVKELVDKLNFIKKEVLARFNMEETTKEWYVCYWR
jgi:conserved oligomeric Golgi complex subunit 5